MEGTPLLMNGEIQNSNLLIEEAQPQDNDESMEFEVRSQRSRRDILDKYYDFWCLQLGWLCPPTTAPATTSPPPCQTVTPPVRQRQRQRSPYVTLTTELTRTEPNQYIPDQYIYFDQIIN
jgi:hypothetical protein